LSGINFTRKESKILVSLINDLKVIGFSGKNYKMFKKKVLRFQDDRTKVCDECGNKFIANRETKVYCSRKCNNQSNYRKRSSEIN